MKESRDYLFHFCFIFALAEMAMIVGEFISRGAFQTSSAATVTYLTLLGAYVLNKEITRWANNQAAKQRKGELFFYLWGVMALTIFLINYLSKQLYPIPKELIPTFLGTLGIFSASGVSKKLSNREINSVCAGFIAPSQQRRKT